MKVKHFQSYFDPLSNSLPYDIFIFFTESSITLLPIAAVSEGEEVQVCVRLSCSSCQGTDSAFSLDVTLAISSTTAGKVHQEIKRTYLTVSIICQLVIGEDFVSDTSLMVALSTIDSEKCVNITTNVDMIIEGNELFNVTLLSTDPASTIATPNFQLATILDNTSRFLQITIDLNCYILYYFLRRSYS